MKLDTARPEPEPPSQYLKSAEHHWLEQLNSDDQSFGYVVLQWNPRSKYWSHSGYVGTGISVETHGWRYVAHCPMPD
jgi:hypothetical protein